MFGIVVDDDDDDLDLAKVTVVSLVVVVGDRRERSCRGAKPFTVLAKHMAIVGHL